MPPQGILRHKGEQTAMAESQFETPPESIEAVDTDDDLQAWDPEEIEDPYEGLDSEHQDDESEEVQ